MVAERRFLIIRLSSIGDVLHCTPVARSLRQAYPKAHITWAVGAVPADLLKTNPYLDAVYVWPRESWETCLRQGRFHEAWELWQQLKLDLKTGCFDVALDVHGLFLSGMLAMASGAPRRIGLANTKELNSWFMTQVALPPGSQRHVIARYGTIVRPLGISSIETKMTLVVDEDNRSWARHFLHSEGIRQGQQFIVLVPATTWPSKNWPAEYFAVVASYLGRRMPVVLCGAPGDRLIANAVLMRSRPPIIDAVGKTSLLQLAALLAEAAVVVSGDTGPLHMAVAVGTPTVSIFGPSRPEKFGPLEGPHTVLTADCSCTGCFKQQCRRSEVLCMKSVTPREVLQAVKQRLLPNASKGFIDYGQFSSHYFL